MDEYHPPPAYGVPYNPSASFNQTYQPTYNPSNAQGNETGYAVNPVSGYSIPGLQAQPTSIHPNFAGPFGEFLQQLQDRNLLDPTSTSFPPKPFITQQPDSNPLTVGEPANASSENDYTPDEELPDHIGGLSGDGLEALDGHNNKDYRTRSESGEISDKVQQLLDRGSMNGRQREDNMLHTTVQFSPLKTGHSSELSRLNSARSAFQSEDTRDSNLITMPAHSTENPPLIPGLEIASTSTNNPSKQDELRNKAIEAVKNFHREGISYSSIIKAYQFTAPELEELKSLFASAKLPIDYDSTSTQNIISQQPKQTDSLRGKPRIEALATEGSRQTATANTPPQRIPSDVGATPAMNKATSRQEYLAKLQAARSKKPITATNALEQAAAPPVDTSSPVIQPPPVVATSVSSAPSTYPAISQAITPAKTELVKQKLEALRKKTAAKLSESTHPSKSLAASQSRPTSSGQSSYSSAIFTEPDDLHNQNLEDDSLNENKRDEIHRERAHRRNKNKKAKNQPKVAAIAGTETVGIFTAMKGTIPEPDPVSEENYDSPVADVPATTISLRTAPSTATRVPVTGSDQPPSTPIPGLFLNAFDSKPSFEEQIHEPQVHPRRTMPSSPAITVAANVQSPHSAGTSGPFGYTLFSPMAQGGPRPVSTSAPTQPFRSNSRSYGQYWQPPQPEKFVINMNDSDGESEDDLDANTNELERTEAATSITQPNAPSIDHGSILLPSTTMGIQTTDHQSAATSTSQTPALAGTSGTSTPSNDIKQKEELAIEKKKMEMKMALMKAKLKAKLAINRTHTPSTPKKDEAVLAEAPITQTTIGGLTPSHHTTSSQSMSNVVNPSPPVQIPSSHVVKQSAQSAIPTLPSPSSVQIQPKKRQSDGSDDASEWRKKRRAEIQSGLQASDQDLASNMAKIADLQRQLARLQEENIQRQQAREKLAKELEDLGVDTEGMSHEEMQKTKDDLDAAQQIEEQRLNDYQKSPVEDENHLSKATEETSVRASPDESDDGSAEAEESDATYESTDIDVTDSAQATAINQTPPTADQPVFPATTGPDNFNNSPLSSLQHPSNLITSTNVELAEGTSFSSDEKLGADEDSMSISSDNSDNTETYEPEMGIPPENIPTELDAEDEDEPYEPMADLPARLTSSEPFSPRPEIITLSDVKQTTSHDSREESDEVANDLAPELQPTGQSIIPLDETLPTYHPYVPYESPLKMFKAYRYHPEYSKNVSQGYHSWTYSHNINTDKEFCPWETSGGICNDTECEYQHFRDVELSGEKLLVQLGTENPGKTDEEKQKWNVGLKELIKDLRNQRVSDSDIVAARIAEYRRKFRGDDFVILNL